METYYTIIRERKIGIIEYLSHNEEWSLCEDQAIHHFLPLEDVKIIADRVDGEIAEYRGIFQYIKKL